MVFKKAVIVHEAFLENTMHFFTSCLTTQCPLKQQMHSTGQIIETRSFLFVCQITETRSFLFACQIIETRSFLFVCQIIETRSFLFVCQITEIRSFLFVCQIIETRSFLFVWQKCFVASCTIFFSQNLLIAC